MKQLLFFGFRFLVIMEWQSYFHTNPMFKEIVTYGEGNWVENSFIKVSEKPGIGVDINQEAMKKYAIPGVPFFEQKTSCIQ